MSSQPIKSFITIHNIDQTTRLDSATNEQVVNSYQCTEPAATVLASLVEQARSGSIAIVTGVRGVGKSHLLAFLRAIIAQPDLIKKVSHPFARRILEKAVDKRPRSQTVVTINCDSEQTDVNLLSTRGDAQIEAACATGKNVFVFIDGLSLLLRRSKREECLQWLVSLAHNADAQRYQLFITLDQDLIEILTKAFSNSQILSAIETIAANNLALVLDQFICPKKPEQKRALDNLYDELCRKVPHFQWSHQDFLQAFPLHPQVLELAPALRTYARTFSLLSFFYTVAPRAIMRRGFNLISLVEVFDTFEYDLRRNRALSYLFSTYDYLLDNFVKALPSVQQFHGKFLLRAITLLSLKERSYTALEIADSVMLFDDSPTMLFRQSMKTIMDFMATAANEKMTVSLVEGEKKFQLSLAEVSSVDPIEEATKTIEDDDSRLIETLIDSGKENFKDWPLVFSSDNNFQRRAEIELIWRGTARRGILKLGGSTEISSNNSKQRNLEWQLTLVSPSSLDQYRTEVPENLVVRYWYPAPLEPDHLLLLKRLLVIRQQGHNLLSPEELKAEEIYLTTQAAKIFSRCYLESGSLGNAQQNTAQTFSSQEKRLPNLLGTMLDPILKNKLSKHPILGDILNERTLKVLARGFFYQSEWSRPELKKYLGQFALPLHIVSLVGENFEFSLPSDIPKDSPLGKILSALERSYAQTINRVDIERLLCNEPFGLQQTLLLLLVLGAAAAGHIILTDNAGEVILTNAGIRSGYDVANYTKVCLPNTLQPQEEPILALPIKTESRFNNLQENVLKEAVAEVLSATPTTKESKPTEEEDNQLLEFYQSGFFSRSAIGNEPTIKSLTTTDTPSITKIRKTTSGEITTVSTNEELLTEPTETSEEDELLEFYQSGTFQKPIIPEEIEKSVEKTPVKLTNTYLRPITENVKPLQEIVPPIKNSSENNFPLSSLDITPLVISKSLLESDLSFSSEIINNEIVSSSRTDISDFANIAPTQETSSFSDLRQETDFANNIDNVKNQEISNINNINNINLDNPFYTSTESKPYEFDFNINSSASINQEIDYLSNNLQEPTQINQINEYVENSLTPLSKTSSDNFTQPSNEFGLGSLEPNESKLEISQIPEILPDQETPPSFPSIDFSSTELEETNTNTSKTAEELSPENVVPASIEDGKFAFDIDLPKPETKATIDIEKALASFEAEKDRLANAPTLSELPVINDIPDPDPNILDLDLSSEALKETQKIPIIKVSSDYLEKPHDKFEVISPNHPTLKLPAVAFSEEDELEQKAKDFGKFATISEVNKITDQLPNVPPLLEESEENLVSTQKVSQEPQEPQVSQKPKVTSSKEVQDIEVDDIYLDPFTGVFEAITFPDEEESKIPASLLVNKFASQPSLPIESLSLSNSSVENTSKNISENVCENISENISENNLESQSVMVEKTLEDDSIAIEASKIISYQDFLNTQSRITEENPTLDDSANALTESEIMTPEIISQLNSTSDLESENLNLDRQGFQTQETPQIQESSSVEEIASNIGYENSTNNQAFASPNESSTYSNQNNTPNNLLDVSLDLDQLNDLVIAEQNEQIASPLENINKLHLDYLASKPFNTSEIETDVSLPTASLFIQTIPPAMTIDPEQTLQLSGEQNFFSPSEKMPLTTPIRTDSEENFSSFPKQTLDLQPWPNPTNEQAKTSPFNFSQPNQSYPITPAPTEKQANLSPFSFPNLSPLPSNASVNETLDLASPRAPITKAPIKEKSLGDLLLGASADLEAPNANLNIESSPIEYVPDEFVFGERGFNIPPPVKPSVMETLPSTTLSAEALPNEIVLGHSPKFSLPNSNELPPTFSNDSFPAVSSILEEGKINKWATPETETDFGFDTIMDDSEIDGDNLSNLVDEKISKEKRFSSTPQPPVLPHSKTPSGLIQYGSISQAPTVDMSSPIAAKILTPSNEAPDSSLPKNQLVMSRKFNNDVIAGRELAILYEKFVQVCNLYRVQNVIPSEEQFRVTVLNTSKSLKVESLSSEILCSVEIVEGEVHVYCQANRSSLFQKRSQRQRVF